jgi:tetratricopeptide (TPR) repeat protein
MAEVYCADDLELNERVALKVLDGTLATMGEFLERFRREIRLSRQIGHRNVARVYDLVQEPAHASGPLQFYALELLQGETLAAKLFRAGRLDSAEVLAISRQLAAGLDAAHATGVLHRDFKPANIMLSGDRAVITDFGLATEMTDATIPEKKQATSMLLGTPGYVAPERWTGQRATPASDIYAFGVVLHEMLTGKQPGPDGRLEGTVPEEWRAAVERSIARDPGLRWNSATEAVNSVRVRRGLARRTVVMAGVGVASCLTIGGIQAWRSGRAAGLGANQRVMIPRVENQTGDEALSAWTTLLGRQLDLSKAVQPQLDLILASDSAGVRRKASSSGVRLVAFASISSAAGELALRLRLELLGEDPAFPNRVWRKEWTARDRKDLLQLAGAAGDWIRSTAGEVPEEVQARRQPPGALSSESWEALGHFQKGEVANRSGDQKAALAYFRESVSIDPAFALALAKVSDLEAQLYNLDQSLESQRRATILLRDRGTATREALRIRLNHAVDCWDFDEGMQVAELMQAQFPEDTAGYFFAADFHRYQGRYGSAVPLYRVAQEKDPGATHIADKLVISLLALQRLDEAQIEFSKKRTSREEPWLRRIEGIFAITQRDFGRAERMFKAMTDSQVNPTHSMSLFSAVHLATMAAERGEQREAILKYEQILDGCRRSNMTGESAAVCIHLAELWLHSGNKGKAAAYALEAGEIGGYLQESFAGEYLYRAQDPGENPRWRSRPVSFKNPRTEAAANRLAGERLAAKGSLVEALKGFKAARTLAPRNFFPNGFIRVLLAAGEWTELELCKSEIRDQAAVYLGRALDYPPGALFRLG